MTDKTMMTEQVIQRLEEKVAADRPAMLSPNECGALIDRLRSATAPSGEEVAEWVLQVERTYFNNLAAWPRGEQPHVNIIRQLLYDRRRLSAALARVEGERREALSKAARLWMLLDDIDTAEDVVKSDDAAFRKVAHNKHRKRFEIMSGEELDAALSPADDSEGKRT